MPPFLIIPVSLLLIGIIVMLILWRLARSGERMIIEEKKRIDNSPRAKARIIEIGKSQNQRRRSNILVKLRLEIYPEIAQPSFQTTTVWEIEPIALYQMQKEAILSVKYDLEEKRRIYPLASWANYNEFICRLWLAQ